MSRQFHPRFALIGAKWPFVVSPFFMLADSGRDSGFEVKGVVTGFFDVRAVSLRFLMGLLLFDLALLSILQSDSSSIFSSIGTGEIAAAFFLADLVIGPK